MSGTYVQFSHITIDDVIAYLRLVEVDESERALLSSILEAARSHILTYTGQTQEKADTFPEFTIACYSLCEEMFDKRTFTTDNTKVNEVVASILGSRSVNLL